MTKIMLVEDDKSLREIYGVRLLAEGYDIVSAGDGELALAMAIKERPDLIISDVMMPKISGFDMLDILRSTSEMRNIKVIIMTALSSEEQRSRGEQLGADRYLVKSQVGIEDVVRIVHEVLNDAPTTQPQAQAPVQSAAPQMQTAPETESSIPQPTAPFSSPRPAALGDRVIQPLKNNPRTENVDINQLLAQEQAREDRASVAPIPQPQPEPQPTPVASQPSSYKTTAQEAAYAAPQATSAAQNEPYDATAQFSQPITAPATQTQDEPVAAQPEPAQTQEPPQQPEQPRQAPQWTPPTQPEQQPQRPPLPPQQTQ